MINYIVFGESHGPCVGIVVEGLPAGLPADAETLRRELLRRAGGHALTTARRERDKVRFISGVYNGKTTGMPICAVIENTDAHSADYDALKNLPRPGHADYTAWVQSGGKNDPRGGGRFSGRLTAPLVAAGALAKQALAERGIEISARLTHIGGEKLEAPAASPQELDAQAQGIIEKARAQGDSVGGVIRCTVEGIAAGFGGPEHTRSVEGIIARHIFGIGGVKAIGFGVGEAFADMRGSEANDAFYMEDGAVKTRTNHNGGVNGGITNGMPVVFDVTVKPTPSIAREQETVDLSTMQDAKVAVTGRHDPCIAARAVVAIEAAAALAVCELLEI